MDKTLRLVRISLLIGAIQRVLRFFSRNLFCKSNRKLFSCVCIAWYKHERGWENSRQLCKPETKSRVCITDLIWKDHRCDSHMINCTFCSWKKIYIRYTEMVWYFIGVNVINRTLHGRFEVLNLSSRVVFKNISLVHCADSWNIFSILEEKFRISKHLCNILFVNNIDLSAEIGDIHRSYYLVKVLRLRWVIAYLLHFPFLGIFFRISFLLFFFNLELKTRPGEFLVLPYICFGPV